MPRYPIQAVFVSEQAKMATIVSRQLASKIPLAVLNFIFCLTSLFCSLILYLVVMIP